MTAAATDATVVLKNEIDTSKMDIDLKVTPIKQEEIKKEETNLNSLLKSIDSTKAVMTTVIETKSINAQINVTTPVVSSSTTAPVENLKTAPVADVSKPAVNTTTTAASTKTQNNNTVTTANGTVRVRKRHQVKVACGKFFFYFFLFFQLQFKI